MTVPLRLKWTHEVHHCELTVSVSLSSSHRTRKWSVAKTSKNRYFSTDARSPFFIEGLRTLATELKISTEIIGGSIECESEKEVNGEPIVVLSWKGHFDGTQT